MGPVCYYHIHNYRFWVSPTLSVKLKIHHLLMKKALVFHTSLKQSNQQSRSRISYNFMNYLTCNL
jgi:hypothetical protein